MDACDATYSIEAAGFAGGMRIEQGKASTEKRNEPFFVRLEDLDETTEDGDRGIRLAHVDPEEAKHLIGEAPEGTNPYMARIVGALGTNGALTRQAITGTGVVRGRCKEKVNALDKLVKSGAVVVDEVEGEKRYRLAS